MLYLTEFAVHLNVVTSVTLHFVVADVTSLWCTAKIKVILFPEHGTNVTAQR
jgi:hypothetical protein